MALTIKQIRFHLTKCKGDRIARFEFRGSSYCTNALTYLDQCLTSNQIFEWPIGRAIDNNEVLSVELLSVGKLSNKPIGFYGLILQGVVRERHVYIHDALVDGNMKPIPIKLEMDVRYTPPEELMTRDIGDMQHLDEEQRMLHDIEQNIANLERTLTSTSRAKNGSSPSSSHEMDMSATVTPSRTKRMNALRSVKSLMRFGRKTRPRRDSSASTDDEEGALLRSEVHTPALSRQTSQSSISDNDSQISLEEEVGQQRKATRLKTDSMKTQAALKAQDYQVCITIIEARQLAGLNMDPVVCIQIGDQKKYTSVKESTNCPYYNEYFVFDFHMPALMLFDKIITLSVLQSRTFLRANKMLGSFKLDVATVCSQPDHQFYHKWALLTDPNDIAGGPKGYLKCDISVIGKGDSVKVPPKSEKDDDDIEANLLLPDGVPIERQRARFIIRIYRADGLPKMNSSIMANVKKALTGEVKDLVDPYVQVSFAGMVGKTTVKKNSYAPVWNEQLIFTEMFPPLCQRIKIQLRDSDPVKPTSVIATHFIDLKTISNDGEKGYLPTFGPSFIHLYGSTRDYSLIDEHSTLNTGLGEGVSYRARLLIAIRTEITDVIDFTPSEVELESTQPINEGSYAPNEEYFLFACILDASMIDKSLSDKPIYFELSIGNAGNAIDGLNESRMDEYDDGELESVRCDSTWHSTTSAIKPMSHDRVYYYLPYWDNKPCMHVTSVWPDNRRRMYNSNIIAKIIDKLEESLHETQHLIQSENANAESHLKQVLEELHLSCTKYLSISHGHTTAPGTGKTKLDKERLKFCCREIEHIGTSAKSLKASVTKRTLKERFKTAQSYLLSLKNICEDPQNSLPDVFLWVISGNKRIAYQRILARDIMYSIINEECGVDCAKVQTVFLKLPGKKGTGSSGWAVQAKLQIYMWLGVIKNKKHFFQGLPKGYEMSHELRNAERPRALPPSVIHYAQKHLFQLRAHIYQARSLIGSDASGLSDPFARVIAGEFSKSTQVIDQTLSPTWDELLVFEEILIYGTLDEIQANSMTVVIEIFDQDKVGKSEFIGRTCAKPHVKLFDEPYTKPKFPPSLEWFEISRGPDHAGELLATFELLELSPTNDTGGLPKLPEFKQESERKLSVTQGKDVLEENRGPVLPVPRGVRPTLAKYRIEVLFWGLRDLKRVHLLSVDKPRVDIECAGHVLYSSIIQNAKRNPNFAQPIKFMDVELPEQILYRPPLTIRAVDCRSFGRFTLVGTHTINSIHKYMYVPMTRRDKEAQERQKAVMFSDMQNNHNLAQTDGNLISLDGANYSGYFGDGDDRERSPLIPKDVFSASDNRKNDSEKKRRRRQSVESEVEEDDGTSDWWTKYFASVERMIEQSKQTHKKSEITAYTPEQCENKREAITHLPTTEPIKKRLKISHTSAAVKYMSQKLSPKHDGIKHQQPSKANVALFKIYPNELEAQPEFEEFREWLHSFNLCRGKKTGDDEEDESRIVGVFKGSVKVYKWPLPKDLEDHTFMGFDPQYGLFQGIPSNEPIHVLVRVYIVKANDLHPMDLNGKADPYICLQLGSKRISDKEHYISKQLNPVFGKYFEIEATFPQDSLLTIQMLDWDLVGADDLIGETRIDLENRFYSRHRATCGISDRYDNNGGYNTWRDPMKPTQILAKLCKDSKLDPPTYMNYQTVKIGRHSFPVKLDDVPRVGCDKKHLEELMALQVLKHWHEYPRIGCALVPEHIETRALYNPDKPGIEQGKLEMWVDMFPMDMPAPGPPIDITPRKPKSYELRVIIWNTDEVVLEDDAFFTGEKMSDIYVKGWLKGPEDCQCTDIHYRSLTGEGNFNWRFIFPFDYMVAEQKIVITRKESLFSWDETQCKIPARLELQVWDADHFSADDFLGAITLDLNCFPRGAKSSKLCTLGMLKTDGSVPMVNIFKQKRVKGWWPFYVKKDNEDLELTGKVEAEFHLLTKEDVEKNPAGFGRNEPDPLEKPNRPDASFMWFLNPLKSIRYIMWHNYKWKMLKVLLVLIAITVCLMFIYAIPGYTVKKILGA